MAQQYDAEREELVNKICKMIQLQLEGTIGHIGQSPYTEMFFAVFEEVYRQGYFVPAPAFRGDNLLETIWARVRHEAWQEEKLTQLIGQFGSRWDEWRYAWDRAAADHGFTLR